ncbi:MAG: hypothetical protein H6591_13270 [Flavobacteriales bacterium]|nr:hypothetical protein [Flavobacteriales bacterium]
MPGPTVERLARWSIWALLLLSGVQRWWGLSAFGFRYIGIDDALIQQVAIDYGHGILREPYLYGQNYNPMLEALLAAPFVRFGVSAWVILPIITSLLALLPFWSVSLWALRRGHTFAAFVFAATPLVLPIEWSLITTMPRGWVHGLAWLALVPWLLELRHAWLRHALTGLVLAAALYCNANALPIAAGIAVWLVLREGRSFSFWVAAATSLALLLGALRWAQGWYDAHPESLTHALLPTDLAFRPDLLRQGLRGLPDHLLHMHPFAALGWVAVLLLALLTAMLLGQKRHREAIALSVAVLVMLLPLGFLKLHEGCASIFFPLSRMMLALPLLLAAAISFTCAARVLPRWIWPSGFFVVAAIAGLRIGGLEQVITDQLAGQECAWVREEPLSTVREHCQAIADAAERSGSALVVAIRWPGLRADHRAHFRAHFTCYACAQLVDGFPPALGAGFDRRSWIREAHERRAQGTVLFVGGDGAAWQQAMARDSSIVDLSSAGLRMHAMRCDTLAPSDQILQLGVDDDLSR